MEEIVKAVKNAYYTSKNKPILDNLRNVLISLMADLKVIKSWRAWEHPDDWLSNMEKIVKAVEDAHNISFKLLESGNFKNEPNLDNLRHVLISLMAKLQEFKSWRVGMRACTCALPDSF
jgi:hypothetical protein